MTDISTEYRCKCGKLLFRGLILSGDVEAKCRFCKEIQKISGLTGSLAKEARYVLFINEKGLIVQSSDSAALQAGFTKKELTDMPVEDLIVILAPTFYSTLWEAIGTKGQSVVLFQSLQRHKDRSMTPVKITAQRFVTPEAQYMLFVVERTSLQYSPFASGGSLK